MTATDQAVETVEHQPNPTGVIVLPWYQNPVNITVLVVTFAIVASMIGWLVGAGRSDETYNEVDIGFLRDMKEHHDQAVVMGFIYNELPDVSPYLRTVATQIVRGQSFETGRMAQFLQEFGQEQTRPENEPSMLWMGMSATPGQMPGMATDAELERLGELSGRQADELFVELMTEHHQGGIEMAAYAAENAANDQVVRMAEGMAAGQADEIQEMEDLLNR